MEWLMEKLLAAPVIGAILKPVINGLLSAQKNRLDAQGSHEAVVADLAQRTIALDQRETEVNANVVIAEQGNWFTRSVRPSLAWIVILVLAKLMLWDKVIGSFMGCSAAPKGTCGTFVTDPLDVHMWWVITTIIVAYFGGRTFEKITTKLVDGWKQK